MPDKPKMPCSQCGSDNWYAHEGILALLPSKGYGKVMMGDTEDVLYTAAFECGNCGYVVFYADEPEEEEEDIEIVSNRIFVGNLDWNLTTAELQELFEKYGEVTDCKIVTDRDTGRSRGFGFVTFAEDSAAEEARELDGTEIEGRTLRVNAAHDKKRRRRKPTRQDNGRF